MIDLSQNKLTQLSDIPQPRLFKANFSENEITSCRHFTGHANIRTLILSKNKLTDCVGIQTMSSLIELNLAENEIASLADMRLLPSLKKLVLDNNKLTTLKNFPELPSLEVLDFSNNPMEVDGELPHLSHLSALQKLNGAGCPFVDEKGDSFKQEVLIFLDMLKHMKSVNDDEVTEEDRVEARELKAERI